MVRRAAGLALRIIAAILVVAPFSAWSALALWFRLPAPEVLRASAAVLFAILGLATIVALFMRLSRSLVALAVFALAFGGLLVWWSTIKPPLDGDWAPDVARQTTGAIKGDILTLSDVRDFDWRTDNDFTERWSKRSYDLSKLKTLDLFLAYWAGPEMAHVIMSFGFEDGDHIAWSVEVRREKTERVLADRRRVQDPYARLSRHDRARFGAGCARTCAARTCASIGSARRPTRRARCCTNMSSSRPRSPNIPNCTIRSPRTARPSSSSW